MYYTPSQVTLSVVIYDIFCRTHSSKNLHNTLHVRSRWCDIHSVSGSYKIPVLAPQELRVLKI
jgi:hypothetical protein